MEGTIRVTPEKLIGTSQEFETTKSKVVELTNKMLDLVNGMNSIWQGDAATAYTTKFSKLSEDMNQIGRMIEEHVKDLQDIAKRYQDAEKVNIENTNALASDIIQ